MVASTHVSETTSSSAAEHLLLHRQLLEHGLEHEVAAGEALVARAARDDSAQEAGFALRQPALCDLAGEVAADRRQRLLDAGLVDVRQHDGDLEAAEEERRQLRRHQAGADDADARDAPRLRVRNADASLGAALDEVERVDRRLRLRPGKEVGERVLLRPVALLERPGGGAFDQVERPVRGGSGAVDGVVDPGAGTSDDLGDVGQVGFPAWRPARLDRREEELDRLVEELDRLEQRVGEPGLESLRPGEHAVLAQRVLDDELHRGLGADEPRDQLRPAPAGDQAEEDLGAGEVPDT